MEINYNTIEKFRESLVNDDNAMIFLKEIRWGQFPRCPFCGNEKCYLVKDRQPFKCARKECYKKFSITVRTIFEATNIKPLDLSTILYLYSKKTGKVNSWDIEKAISISAKGGVFMKQRIDFAWPYVLTANRSVEQKLIDLFKTSCDIYDKKIELDAGKNSWFGLKWPEGLLNISNEYHYSVMVDFVRLRMWYRKTWYWMDFASPEEVITETFLWMIDRGIKEYDSKSIMKYLSNRMDIMFYNFLKKHPRHYDFSRIRSMEHKRLGRFELAEWYIVTLILNQVKNKLTRSQIKRDKQLIENKRKSITEKRGLKYLILQPL